VLHIRYLPNNNIDLALQPRIIIVYRLLCYNKDSWDAHKSEYYYISNATYNFEVV